MRGANKKARLDKSLVHEVFVLLLMRSNREGLAATTGCVIRRSAVPDTRGSLLSGGATVLTKAEMPVPVRTTSLASSIQLFMPTAGKSPTSQSRRLVSGRNGPVMSSGSACSSPVTIFCNGCSGSSICIRWPSRMPRKAHQHPKLEQYGEGIFIVARTAQMVEGRIAFGETHLFVGRGYVVSVRHGASSPILRCASAARPVRPFCRRERITSSMRSSTSSSTITCRSSRESTPKSRRSRTPCWRPRSVSPTSSACTCFAAICCVCAMRPGRWSKYATGSSTPS